MAKKIWKSAKTGKIIVDADEKNPDKCWANKRKKYDPFYSICNWQSNYIIGLAKRIGC